MTDAPPLPRALRTAALYLALVGLPALGVAATLRVGSRIDAPPSVGGTWRVVPPADGCALAAGALEIHQSGARLEGRYVPAGGPAQTVQGRVEERRFVLADGGGVRIVGVTRTGRPDQLAAVLETGACSFRTTAAALVRVPEHAASGGH